jgi:hypothetical protein
MKSRHAILISLLLAVASSGQYQKPILGEMPDWSHPLARGLVGCWLMNEGAGIRVNDLSGNGNHGTAAAPLWAGGRFGSCLGAVGTAQYVSFPTLQVSTTEWTVSLWFCVTDLTANRTLFSASVSGSTDERLRIYVDTAGTLSILSDYSTALSGSSGLIVVGRWYHVVVTYNFAGQVARSYHDGRLLIQDSSFSENAGTPWIMAVASYNWSLSGTWRGQVDQLQVWKRELLASEIAQLYRDPFTMFRRERIDELWAGSTSPEPSIVPQVIIIARAGIPVWVIIVMVTVGVHQQRTNRRDT